MGIRALYGRKIERCGALKFGDPGNPVSGNPVSAQSSDLLVELCQSLIQNLLVARVFCRVELL
jgi:hypothetical protein